MYEELVKRLREAPSDWYDADLHYESADAIESTSKAYQMMAEAYESEVTKHYWIPVTERLPEEYSIVLLYSYGDVVVGFYDSEYKEFRELNGFHRLCTHWMPIPESPKEE